MFKRTCISWNLSIYVIHLKPLYWKIRSTKGIIEIFSHRNGEKQIESLNQNSHRQYLYIQLFVSVKMKKKLDKKMLYEFEIMHFFIKFLFHQ